MAASPYIESNHMMSTAMETVPVTNFSAYVSLNEKTYQHLYS